MFGAFQDEEEILNTNFYFILNIQYFKIQNAEIQIIQKWVSISASFGSTYT